MKRHWLWRKPSWIGLWLRKTNSTERSRTMRPNCGRVEDLLSAKLIELAEVETEYRAASSKRFSPTQSVAASVEPLSDPEPETDDTSQDGALGPDDAPGACVERHVPETETQVRHDVAEGKRRCGSAPPATTDLAGRPLSAPSVELFVRGTATYNEMEIARLNRNS